ncbi:hypothetical protein [Paenibacillus sp. WLX2291]|uniref:hypothetical protein n=1 Tax=Paenibacillus sp. WLX2291 TaxID=3296934 RepID=UPI0039842C83
MYRKAAFGRAKIYVFHWVAILFMAFVSYILWNVALEQSGSWIALCFTLLIMVSLWNSYSGTARARHYRHGKGFMYYRMADWQMMMREWIIVLLWAAIFIIVIFSPWSDLTIIGITGAIAMIVLLYQRFMTWARRRRQHMDQQLIHVLKQRRILNEEENVTAIYGNLKVSAMITDTVVTGIDDLHVFRQHDAAFMALTEQECIIGTQQPGKLFVYTSIPYSRIHQLAVLSGGTSYKNKSQYAPGMILIVGDEQARQCNVKFSLATPSVIQRSIRELLNQMDMMQAGMDRLEHPINRTHDAYIPFEHAREVSTLETYAPFER